MYICPLFSIVSKCCVKVNQKIKKGDVVFQLEAMKMLIEVTAEEDAEVKKILVKVGQQIINGSALIELN